MLLSTVGLGLLYTAQLALANCNHDNCLRAVIASAFTTRSGSADCTSYFQTTVETNSIGQTVSVITPTNIPTYASACSGSVRYSSACSCVGASNVVITTPAPTPTCAAGTLSCNGGPCQDVLSDPNNCGVCGNVKWWPKLTIPAIKAIKPDNRYNMDEAGIIEGIGDNGLVVGSIHKRFIQKKHPGSKAWTSFIECISAIGRSLDPLVIFKGKSVQQQWFKTTLDEFKGWKFTSTENGWTIDDTALEWLQKVFILQTALHDLSEARLLVLDGHGSHETIEFM
ncbi:hypothetical protein OIDMADRAFT_46918 [Oidiodendron maius Zn]|uniref:DDE-1 domain-containing protein n=1 Tax=Oidiodendron maius (strain Zn) TaxID=913774 RepID=A0A0C3D6Q6_OIDMZ|nr:hypothetical protein OIDMADRAFT_46918 [Oidiodendron maius Zn]